MVKTTESSAAKLGQILLVQRKKLGLSLRQVHASTKIKSEYLKALEKGEWANLPEEVYVRGFIKRYASLLGLTPGPLVNLYANPASISAPVWRPKLRQRRVIFTLNMVAALAAGLSVVVVAGYLGWQWLSLAAAPRLSLASPASDMAVAEPTFELQGRTTPGNEVTINSTPVAVEADGSFKTTIGIQAGDNVLSVTAKSKLGKTTTIVRHLVGSK